MITKNLTFFITTDEDEYPSAKFNKKASEFSFSNLSNYQKGYYSDFSLLIKKNPFNSESHSSTCTSHYNPSSCTSGHHENESSEDISFGNKFFSKCTFSGEKSPRDRIPSLDLSV